MFLVTRPSLHRRCLLAISIGLLLAATAHAQSPRQQTRTEGRAEARAEARRLLREGNKAFDRGDHAAALEKFELALQVFPSARIQYNIGQALRELGRPVEATEAFDTFLEDAERITSQERKETAVALRELSPRVARLTLTTNVPGVAVTVDNRSRGTTPLPRDLVLAPGAHQITLGRAGYRPARETITLTGGERRTTNFTLVENEPAPPTSPPANRGAPASAAAAPPAPAAGLAPAVPVAPAAVRPTSPSILQTPPAASAAAVTHADGRRAHTVVGVSLLTASAALAVGGGILMGSAWSRFNDAEGSCGADCATAADAVDSRILWSKLLFGAAALSGAGGAGVFLFSPGQSSSRQAAGRGLLLVKSGRF